jgi:dTDP-4-amino-4,6-dideoxygalactose transaminase
MIPVTKPFTPPIEEYTKLLQGIWDRNWLTNNGPLVNELELKLKEYLSIPYLLYLSNGTIALQIAIKALELKGEIITTPFSYVATSSSIIWEGCKPVFVDIDEKSLNIDFNKIEKAITPETTAILATHVFGNPCDIDEIGEIAKKHNLKVIYDAAHCFGTKYKGKSVFAYGDISTTSFHATKLFHTVEGGAVFSNSPELLKKMSYLRNFGHDGPEYFAEVGINGKNSEFHAAMGLVNLTFIDAILERRKMLCKHYDNLLESYNIRKQVIYREILYNYAYYPVIFESEQLTTKVFNYLENNGVSPRRYFFPSLNTVKLFNPNECLISENIAKSILCLPLFHDLTLEDVDVVADLVLKAINL